jgi:hypothetical protein
MNEGLFHFKQPVNFFVLQIIRNYVDKVIINSAIRSLENMATCFGTHGGHLQANNLREINYNYVLLNYSIK